MGWEKYEIGILRLSTPYEKWLGSMDLALALGMKDDLLRIQRTSRQYSMDTKNTTKQGK
jgi:hypothetical protein